ncbi:hypothetical protein P10VF_197 [Rhizobium phage vB_RleM_P10VF]|uniref:Uncharacterized protein n=1 Tax=Rhizobium phage vB_RleM_P10VF TaxID=1527770 RepID=A0A076YLZ7_9CAUD|nr:hypothetical protein P10VF_197 [Rhizobium phage vB_RleM_P10VF]AIK68410.1 hypothetical protein P10VF_197 [Rhizobium phage vB_RleM_P10VF]
MKELSEESVKEEIARLLTTSIQMARFEDHLSQEYIKRACDSVAELTVNFVKRTAKEEAHKASSPLFSFGER